jgi:hypothetical protein
MQYFRVSGLRKPTTLASIGRKSLARTAEIPVFGETNGGDGFDHHCAEGVADASSQFVALIQAHFLMTAGKMQIT